MQGVRMGRNCSSPYCQTRRRSWRICPARSPNWLEPRKQGLVQAQAEPNRWEQILGRAPHRLGWWPPWPAEQGGKARCPADGVEVWGGHQEREVPLPHSTLENQVPVCLEPQSDRQNNKSGGQENIRKGPWRWTQEAQQPQKQMDKGDRMKTNSRSWLDTTGKSKFWMHIRLKAENDSEVEISKEWEERFWMLSPQRNEKCLRRRVFNLILTSNNVQMHQITTIHVPCICTVLMCHKMDTS